MKIGKKTTWCGKIDQVQMKAVQITEFKYILLELSAVALLLNSVHKRNLWYKRMFDAYFRLNKSWYSPAGIVLLQKMKIKGAGWVGWSIWERQPMVSCLSLWCFYKFLVGDKTVFFWFQFSVSFRLVLLLPFINLNISRNHCSEKYTYSIDFRNLYGSSISCFFSILFLETNK